MLIGLKLLCHLLFMQNIGQKAYINIVLVFILLNHKVTGYRGVFHQLDIMIESRQKNSYKYVR